MPEDTQVDGVAKLSALLSSREAFVTYRPLRGEVPFSEFVVLPEGAVTYEIAPRASLDPFTEAEAARTVVGPRRAAVLLPGRRFDGSGTRYGQGGGWYDRFLKEVPREWLRIGFCRADQFSEVLLPREEWDQSVDFVAVASTGTLRFIDASATMRP